MIKSSLDKLAETEDIEIIWKSYELRPQHAPPLPPDQEQAYKERIAAGWPRTQQMAREVFGVEMQSHRWGVKSRPALEGAKFAEEKGLGEPYHEAMFKAHFVEDLDIGDHEVLAGLAETVGLDRVEFLAALNTQKYANEVDLDIAQAQAYSLNGVPAIIIQNKYLISGAQPLEALQDIVRQVKARERLE
jgi:predicted DsbA family dithiol-disulfide isomerase